MSLMLSGLFPVSASWQCMLEPCWHSIGKRSDHDRGTTFSYPAKLRSAMTTLKVFLPPKPSLISKHGKTWANSRSRGVTNLGQASERIAHLAAA
jgi:hypothetical protein